MTTMAAPSPLTLRYPTARIRGRCVTRSTEVSIGWAILDAALADALGRDHIGWLVGGHPGPAAALGQFARLDANPEGGVWIVVPHSRQLASDLFAAWPNRSLVDYPPTLGNSTWRSRKVWVAIPEDLRHFRAPARQTDPGVAGIIVLDPPGRLHESRGGTNWRGENWVNDRPQRVVDFRADLTIDGWQPPLIVLTSRPAKAVDPDVVARAYALDGLRFIDGDSFACWEVPIEPEPEERA